MMFPSTAGRAVGSTVERSPFFHVGNHATVAPVTSASRSSGQPGEAKVVVLAVTGSIAAYKAAEIARALRKAGARVLPVMSRAAAEFVGPLTLSGITGEKTLTDMWDPDFAGELHVDLARRADVIVIAPATADVLA